ncbi:MAG: VWA domain-containing protein [Anaerolineae bacterium]
MTKPAYILTCLLLWLTVTTTVLANGELNVEIAQIDNSNYPEVTLYVSVTDEAGEIVGGLAQENFTVTEDGKKVDIVAFTAGVRNPISTILVIDRSESMAYENKLEGAKEAAIVFVDLMRGQDKTALVAFDENVVTLQPFSSDKAALKSKIQAIGTGGCTAWYDAVYYAVDIMSGVEGRRSIILLSDGLDCREDIMLSFLGQGSTYTFEEAVAHAREVEVPIQAIGLGGVATQEVSHEGFDEVRLRRVASETGGKYFHAPSAEELKDLYESLSIQMQKEYVITYRSPRPTYDGTRRDIEVKVSQGPGGEGEAVGGGTYLEKHLVNIRSDWRVFVALLLPLLVFLLLPPVLSKVRVPKVEPSLALPVEPSVIPMRRPEPIVQPPLAVAGIAPPGAWLKVAFPLVKDVTAIGRDPTNDIVLKDESVAPQQAQIRREGERYVIYELGAGNTFVSFGGDPGQERPVVERNALKDGSTLRLGKVRAMLRHQPPEAAKLVVRYALGASTIAVGRDGSNDIVLQDPTVSFRHAQIRAEGDRYVVYELGSSNGTFVSFGGDPGRERQVTERNALKNGSTLRFGQVRAVVEISSVS